MTEMSSEIDWDTETQERYHFLAACFDVRKAKRLIVKKPRKIQRTDITCFRKRIFRDKLNEDGSKTICIFHALDWQKIDSDDAVDLKIPIILATLEDDHWPIDGYHRIALALEKNIDELPCVVLTEKETKSIRL